MLSPPTNLRGGAPSVATAACIALWALLGVATPSGARADSRPAPQSSSAPVTVSVDLSSLDDTTYQHVDGLSLHERLVLRLVQEGFAVVERDAAIAVTLRGTPNKLLVIARRPDSEALRRTIELAGAPPPEAQLEIVQKVVTLARTLASRPTPPSPKPLPLPDPSPPEDAAAPPREHWRTPPDRPVELHAGVAALARRGGVDVLPRLGARFAVTRDVGLIAELTLAPAGDAALDVVEWNLLVGATYRLELHRWLSLEAGLEAGVLVHHYTLTSRGGDSGVAADFSAALPVRLGVWPAPVFGVLLRVEPGVASSTRDHRDQEGVIWSRGWVRGAFGADIALRF